jgi:hypothetical protein
MTTGTVTQLNPKPEQPANEAEKVPAKKAPAAPAAPASAANKAPAAEKAPAKKAPAKAAKATPPRDLSKVTAKEQSELRRFVLNMVWATPLHKFRKEAGIPGEVTDQAILDAIDIFAKYIHPASYNNGTRRS